ncbi:transporter [Variovorax sp. YR216]|uniref:SphA family protein n=1 Tax=Variovorax sp. YR216 TaxID=1882828 RepID=UPI000898DBDB|nr:transporter [Variovorax sp. YR216]SEB16085.1 Uncharacterized conserved protein [Variovorax sp. YR216]
MQAWKFARPCVAAAALAACAGAAWALEKAATHAALGFTDSLHGAVFDPGFYVRLDLLEYRTTRYNDQDGNRAYANFGPSLAPYGVPPGTPGTRGPVNLDATGTYAQLTLFKQTETAISFLGSDTLGFGATFLYGEQHVDLNATVPVFAALGLSPFRDLGSNSVTSFGDTAIFPLFLGWKFGEHPPWSMTANPLNFYVKTGSYDRNRAQNIGRNYNSWAPQLGVTYFDKAKQEGFGAGLEASVLFNYLRNGTNNDTHYRNGDEFFVSFGLMQWFNATTKAGISGYYYRQITDDTRYGVPVFSAADPQPDLFNNGVGNRAQVSGIGPTVEWFLYPHWTINLHWHHEFQSRNLPQADRVWFKAAYKF